MDRGTLGVDKGSLFLLQYILLVKVRFGETQKYVKVADTEEGWEDFNTFTQKGYHFSNNWEYLPEQLL